MEAKDFLTGNITCVLKKGDEVITSERTGISPMLTWISEGRDLRGFSAADRVVGKAAAMLFVKAGIVSVYAGVMSIPGRDYLEAHGIHALYSELTEKIINRKGDGLCPMESAVLHISDAEEGYTALVKRAAELRAESENA